MLINRQFHVVFILIFMMLCSSNSWSKNRADNPDSIQGRIKQPTKISTLAQYVIGRSGDEQREFAILTLDALVGAYSQVLQHSSQSRPHTQAGRQKQITWGWATSRMIASLKQQLKHLERGAPFSLRVDHLHRVSLIIDGQVVEVTGPRFRSQSRFEQQIVEFFCLTRDCSWLEPQEPKKSDEEVAIERSLSRGIWHFQQDGKPTYIIGGVIYYEFSDYTTRDKKTELCRKITEEIEQFVFMTNTIKNTERIIYWSYLMQHQPNPKYPELELIKGDSETKLNITLLSSLDQSDWKRLIDWLYNDGIRTGKILNIRHLDNMKDLDLTSIVKNSMLVMQVSD